MRKREIALRAGLSLATAAAFLVLANKPKTPDNKKLGVPVPAGTEFTCGNFKAKVRGPVKNYKSDDLSYEVEILGTHQVMIIPHAELNFLLEKVA